MESPSETPQREHSIDYRTPKEHLPTPSTPTLYIHAAQRLVTLEQRLYIPPTIPLTPLTSLQRQLQIYESPYDHRQSPASLPSRAKYYFRGPSRRAPPNTPVDVEWDEHKGEGQSEAVGELHTTGVGGGYHRGGGKINGCWGREADGLDVEVDDGDDGGSSSGYNTPCPTPNLRQSGPCSSNKMMYGISAENDRWDLRSGTKNTWDESVENHSTFPSRFVSFSPKGTPHKRRAYDLSTLEGIALEIGQEITLGYEIRHFAWKKSIISLSLLVLPALAFPTQPQKRFSAVQIYSSRRPTKCLGTTFIRVARPGIGVDLVDCTSPQALLWDIERGAGYVTVSGLNLVLDAGNVPANFGFTSTETPVQGRASQNWYYTNDNRIAVTDDVQCLDDDGTRLQTYRCTTGNSNQVFYTRTPSTQPPPFDPYPNLPRGTVYPDQSPDRRRLHPLNRGDLCVTIMGNSFTAGNDVSIAYCVADSDPSAKYQVWNAQATFARISGPIIAADNTNYCLSSLQSNGARATLQPCSGGALLWQWSQVTQHFTLQGNQFCLDVQRGSQPGNESPLQSQRKLQSWQCNDSNVQQQWTFLWN